MQTLMRAAGAVVVSLIMIAALMIGSNILLVKFTSATSAVFIGVTLVLAAVYHGCGGRLAAALTRGNDGATLGLMICGTALLLTSVVQTWNQMPKWYSLAMVVIAPTAIWLGARFGSPAGKAAAGMV